MKIPVPEHATKLDRAAIDRGHDVYLRHGPHDGCTLRMGPAAMSTAVLRATRRGRYVETSHGLKDSGLSPLDLKACPGPAALYRQAGLIDGLVEFWFVGYES